MRQKAVAIRYQSYETLPKFAASGSGQLASATLAIASEHGIPIIEDAALDGAFSSEGSETPKELLPTVAQA